MTILDLGLKVRWPKTRCFDWLIMYDRSSPTKAKVYCGSIDAIKEPTFLTFNHPVFKFKSNPKGSQRGFLIKFEGTHISISKKHSYMNQVKHKSYVNGEIQKLAI